MAQRETVVITEIDFSQTEGVAPAVEALRIARPEMIDDARLPFRVARDVVPGSLTNGRRVAAEINRQNPGSKLKILTEPELLETNRVLKDQLKGRDFLIWTETEHEDFPGYCVLRRQFSDYRYCLLPGDSYGYGCGFAVRFVEDK